MFQSVTLYVPYRDQLRLPLKIWTIRTTHSRALPGLMPRVGATAVETRRTGSCCEGISSILCCGRCRMRVEEMRRRKRLAGGHGPRCGRSREGRTSKLGRRSASARCRRRRHKDKYLPRGAVKRQRSCDFCDPPADLVMWTGTRRPASGTTQRAKWFQ